MSWRIGRRFPLGALWLEGQGDRRGRRLPAGLQVEGGGLHALVACCDGPTWLGTRTNPNDGIGEAGVRAPIVDEPEPRDRDWCGSRGA